MIHLQLLCTPLYIEESTKESVSAREKSGTKIKLNCVFVVSIQNMLLAKKAFPNEYFPNFPSKTAKIEIKQLSPFKNAFFSGALKFLQLCGRVYLSTNDVS